MRAQQFRDSGGKRPVAADPIRDALVAEFRKQREVTEQARFRFGIYTGEGLSKTYHHESGRLQGLARAIEIYNETRGER